MKKAILAVSFGTSYESALEKSITKVENCFHERFPEYDVYRAFTSGMVINILRNKRIEIQNIDDALKAIYDKGYEKVIIQPTHLISGDEYDKLCDIALKYKENFKDFKIGVPLLNGADDLERVCNSFHEKYCRSNNFLLLMGHGTEHNANKIYSDMNKICAENGFNNMFIATVEASPSIDDAINIIKEQPNKKVVLTPLMLVAGDHAQNDMAGSEPYSWKSRLEAVDKEVEVILKGMGEYEEFRDLYISHLEVLMSD